MPYPGCKTTIVIIHDKDTAADLQSKNITSVMSKEMQAAQLERLINGLGMGSRIGSLDLTIDDGTAVAASDTLTLTAVSTAADTILINGVTLTAVASGAVNNQWNVLATATLQAADIVRAINASTSPLVSGQVLATSALGVVTLTSKFLGLAGNAVTTAKGVDAGTVMTFSAARLAGGLASGSSLSAPTYKHGV